MHICRRVRFGYFKRIEIHITDPLNGGQIVCTRNYMCGAVQPIDFQRCLFYCIVFHFRCIFFGRFVGLLVRLLHFIMFTLLVVALIDSHAVNWVVADGD